MSNPLSKEALSCKKWGNYVVHSERGVLIALWYIALLIGEILSGSANAISAREAFATHIPPIGGIIGLYGLICIVGCLIFPVVWCIKSYNFLLNYKPGEKFYVETGGKAGLLRCIPIIHFYSKFKIMKDLYRNLTEEKINKKKGIRVRYICFILCLLSILVFLAGSVIPLPYMNIVNFFIALVFATISIGTFNTMIQTMGDFFDKFFDKFNVVKGVTKKSDENVEEETETISNVIITEEVKEEKEVKKFNYKPILYIALILALAWLFIPFIISTIRMNKNTRQNQTINNVKVEAKKQEEKKENNNTVSDQQIFENTLKCQELKDQFYKEASDRFDWASVYHDYYGTVAIPLLTPKDVEVFYSPVTNSCIGIAQDFANKWGNDSKIELGQGYYYISDILTSNRCIIKDDDYYDDNGKIIQRENFSACRGLPEYDDNIFSMYTFTGDNIDEGFNFGKKVYENEVNYLKGN